MYANFAPKTQIQNGLIVTMKFIERKYILNWNILLICISIKKIYWANFIRTILPIRKQLAC